MTTGLTRRQFELLTFIDEYVEECGSPPSFEEMRAALGLTSKFGIHRLLTGLEERGYIRRLPKLARSLAVRVRPHKLPEAGALQTNDPPPPPPTPKSPPKRRRVRLRPKPPGLAVELPRDLERTLKRLSRQAAVPPSRIIVDALRDYIMEAA